MHASAPSTAASAREIAERPAYRLLRRGVVREVLRGVYVDALVPDHLSTRAAAAALVLPPAGVLCRSTVAWLRGIARWLPRPMALAAVDSAAHLALVDLREAAAEIERFAGHRGAAQARELISHGRTAHRVLRRVVASSAHPGGRFPAAARAGAGEQFHSSGEQVRADDARRLRLRREFGWDVVGFHRGHVWGTSLALERAVGELLGMAPQLVMRRW